MVRCLLPGSDARQAEVSFDLEHQLQHQPMLRFEVYADQLRLLRPM